VGRYIEIELKYSKKIKINYLRGQYLDIYFDNFYRSYSILKIDEENNLIYLLLSPVSNGQATRYFDSNPIGQVLRAVIPQGSFTFREHTSEIDRSIFICTGSGIAPVCNMFSHLHTVPKGVMVYWGVRNCCEKVEEIKEFFGNNISIYISQDHSKIRHKTGRISWNDLLDKELVSNWYLVGNPEMISDFNNSIQSLGNGAKIFKDPFV
jgi:NAD(P)H-flavin reductase